MSTNVISRARYHGLITSHNSSRSFVLELSSSRAGARQIKPIFITSSAVTRYLVSLDAPGWALSTVPLKLTIETDDDGTVIASDDKTAQYGEGHTGDGAIADYVSSLIEYYELLEARAAGHQPTARLFGRLQDVLKRSENSRLVS